MQGWSALAELSYILRSRGATRRTRVCCAGLECPVRSGRTLGTAGEAHGKPPALSQEHSCRGKQDAGLGPLRGTMARRGSESRPFYGYGAAGGLFQHSFQKNRAGRSKQLAFRTAWGSGGLAGEQGSPASQTRLRGAGWECAQGTPWLREGRVQGPSLALLLSPQGPMEPGASTGQGPVEMGTSDTLILPRCLGSLVPCSPLAAVSGEAWVLGFVRCRDTCVQPTPCGGILASRLTLLTAQS